MGRKTILVSLLPLAFACSDLPDAPIEGSESLQDQIRELYERARRSGEEVPADAYEWAREDIEKIGDWEYRVLAVESVGDRALEEQLNELGSDRWEAFWIEPRPGGLRVVLKRPSRSYLRHVPLQELRHLIPGGGE